MTLEKKSFNAKLALKAAGEPGEFEAVFATMNVVDLDGDVTIPGAFGKQSVVVESWNHQYALPPVGRGDIFERENEAVIAGKFFLDTPSGAEHYAVVKGLQDIQEFSYSFVILEAEFGKHDGKEVRFLKKMDVFGVGPVTRGAGIDTRVTSIKGQKPDPKGGDEGEHHESGSSEGETGDGKPSGAGPGVTTEMDILEMELED